MTDARITITHHAALRYCERVDPSLTPIEAIALIRRHAAAIEVAATFGGGIIRLANGARLVLSGWDVVTVLARRQFPPFPTRALWRSISGAPYDYPNGAMHRPLSRPQGGTRPASSVTPDLRCSGD